MIPLRIFRSFTARYYDDDILYGPTAYPDEYFAKLVTQGFNAVWLRGTLRDLASTDVFPDLGTEITRHQDALATVVARAQQHDVQVLLYLNEPLCLPREHTFWSLHPEVRGAAGKSVMDNWPETYAFCTSTPEMQAWLRQVTKNLFTAVPELGGWFLISASEHHTSCYSHIWDAPGGQRPDCPRCATRAASEVVAELITALHDGTRAASATAATIAWNWGWTQYEPDPQPSLLSQLPKDITVLIDWERGGHRLLPTGKPNFVDEYSLAYVGPSERFSKLHAEAQRQHLPVMAKLQVGTTHELATVPNLPLVDHLYEKLLGVERLGLQGMLATWNFGNSFSLNTAAIGRFVEHAGRPTPSEFVARLAEEYFDLEHGGEVADAVAQFSAAMAWFPFDIPLLYAWPGNYALSYPLTLAPLTGKSMGWSWQMHERGDDLTSSASQFTIPEIIEQLQGLLVEWEKGLARYQQALAGSTNPHADVEIGVATVIGCVFQSTLHIYQTYLLRRDRPEDMKKQYHTILDDEIINLEKALPYLAADPRLGFHAECQGQMFSVESVEAKLSSLREQRKEFDATNSA